MASIQPEAQAVKSDDAAPSVELTLFASKTALDGARKTFSWSEIGAWASDPPNFSNKLACPMFRTGVSPDNSRREGHQPFEQWGALVVEHDFETMTLKDAAGRLRTHGIAAIGFTSANHLTVSKKSRGGPRWRVILPLAQHVAEATEYERLVRCVNGVLDGVLAPESTETTRCWFYGRVKGVPYESAVIDGACIDYLDTMLGFDEVPLADEVVPKRDGATRAQRDHGGLERQVTLDGASEKTLIELKHALQVLLSDERTTWVTLGLALASLKSTPLAEQARELWVEWGASSTGHKDGDEAQWDTFKANEITYKSIFTRADEVDPGWRERAKEAIALAAAESAAKAADGAAAELQALIDQPEIDGDELARRVLAGVAFRVRSAAKQEQLLKSLAKKTGSTLGALRKDLADMRRRGPQDDGSIVVNADMPMPTARAVLAQRYTINGEIVLRRHQGQFYEHNGRYYEPRDDEDVKSKVWGVFAGAGLEDTVKSRGAIDSTFEAMKALCNVPGATPMPSWLGEDAPGAIDDYIPVRNGLLHVPTLTLEPHTAMLFNSGTVDVVFDPAAPEPVEFLRFLESVFPGDRESRDTLQEIVGYLLTDDTSQQKGFIFVGPPRSGKGTVGRVVRPLVGDSKYTGPSLNQLGRQFGRQGLVGKSLAMIPDARLSGQADLQAAAETILNITGEDSISVERKNLPDWVGKLNVRFVLMTNVLPGLVDPGGAVASRFIVLRFGQSFLGREDTTLDSKLKAEMSGILNWALAGLARLRARGHFIQPKSGEAAVDELRRRTTPLIGFIDDRLQITGQSGDTVNKDLMYRAYEGWCVEEGLKYRSTKAAFLAELYGLCNGKLTSARVRGAGGAREQVVAGVNLVGAGEKQVPADVAELGGADAAGL